MKQVLLIVYAGTESHEAMGRVTNALMMAKELKENGHEVEIAFDGAGVQWLERLEAGDHMPDVYEELRGNVASVCDFCADAFDAEADDDLREDDFEGHQSFAGYFEDDWEILTF